MARIAGAQAPHHGPSSVRVECHYLTSRIRALHISEQRKDQAICPAKLHLHMRRRARLPGVIQIDDQRQKPPLGQARGRRTLPVQSARPKLSLRGQLTNRFADLGKPGLVQKPDDRASRQQRNHELHQQQTPQRRARKSRHPPHRQRLPGELCFLDRFIHMSPSATVTAMPGQTVLASQPGPPRKRFRPRAFARPAAPAGRAADWGAARESPERDSAVSSRHPPTLPRNRCPPS